MTLRTLETVDVPLFVDCQQIVALKDPFPTRGASTRLSILIVTHGHVLQRRIEHDRSRGDHAENNRDEQKRK